MNSCESDFNPLDYPIAYSRPMNIDPMCAWIEHIPFGMFLIELLKPKVLVELGTFSGGSYLSFCQAIKNCRLDTKAYAVDLWSGDAQTGYYGNEVLSVLRQKHDQEYGGFSRLIQSSFDDAKQYFDNHSIDLLHIDGYHTYEAVCHDFTNWIEKLSDRSIVIFHDINVRERNFGVWKFWEEIKNKYPSIEFPFCHGLGCIYYGQNKENRIESFFERFQNDHSSMINYFYALGSKISLESSKDNVIGAVNNSLLEMKRQSEDRDKKLNEILVEKSTLQSKVEELSLQAQNLGIDLAGRQGELSIIKNGYEKSNGKIKELCELNQELQHLLDLKNEELFSINNNYISIKNSLSFRIGKILTSPFRAIRNH